MAARKNADALPPALRWAIDYLPEYFTDEPSRFHVDLLRALADPGKRLIARVAPRGHAKSTCAALAYPLWCICQRRRRNIVIVTHETSLARQFVSDIRTELETNERILADYGDVCGGSENSESRGRKPRTQKRAWSSTKFTTSTGITVQAKGSGASFRGLRVGPQRPDLVICDDLEKDEHVRTPEQRRKLENWLRRVVMPALAPDGQLLVLGSIIHYDSLLANLRDPKRFPRWDYAVYRALEAEPAADAGFRRISLWPARWPVEKLDLERERIGTLAFEQEYQANPIDDSLRVFRPEWLRRYEAESIANAKLTHLMAVDPATGTTGGDYFALWVGGIDDAGTIYTRVLALERIGVVEQVRRVIAAFEQWRPVKIGIETVAYQAALKEILAEESRRRGLYLPLVAIATTSNKRARIEGASAFFENGTFLLPATLPPEVESQFLHFPKAKHDDAPDVCAMAIELARGVCGGLHVEALVEQSRALGRRGGW